MSRRAEAAFRHGLRVRLGGPLGPKGVLLRCEGRYGAYWRVRLQGGLEWQAPDGIVVDGPGEALAPEPCASCGLPFICRAGSGELLCDRCTAEQFGTAVRASEPAPTRTFDHVPPHRRRR